MNRHKLMLLFCFLMLLCLIPYALFIFQEEIFWNWRRPAIEESKRRGETIMRLISAFKKENGRNPITLDELCPNYINDLPQPTAGGGFWRYHITKDGDYILAFGMPEEAPYYFYPKCTLDQDSGTWYLDE